MRPILPVIHRWLQKDELTRLEAWRLIVKGHEEEAVARAGESRGSIDDFVPRPSTK